ncbi:MAG: hypothetical protein KDK70_33320 [Myxococcales bacterium]|nr:hypothetical protein [Myxococcales bacterium]
MTTSGLATEDSGDETSSGPGTTDDTTTTEGTTGPSSECGNDMIEGEEVCDGTDLDHLACGSQGFDGGQLACADDCMSFDTSGCVYFTCGNGVLDGSDICDGADLGGATCQSIGMNFDGGTLGCENNCRAFDTSECSTCGNVIVEGDEPCDGVALLGHSCEDEGFEYGQLGCLADCTDFDTSGCGLCGDGSIGGAESCDGADLAGQTCASLGLTGGTLGCTASCTFDFTMCEIPGTPFGSDVGYNGFMLQPGVLPCDDISATGTPTLLTDDSALEVPMGFQFPVYGVLQSNITIQSNGTIRWGDNTYLTYNNTCLPSATAPSTNVLYVFWDDLNPSLGLGEVYYQTLGMPGAQRFVVQWDTANFGGDTVDLMRLQAMFHEATGQIDVCYVDTINAGNTANSGAEATAGIQLDSTTGLQFSCNTPDLTDGTQLMYVPI